MYPPKKDPSQTLIRSHSFDNINNVYNLFMRSLLPTYVHLVFQPSLTSPDSYQARLFWPCSLLFCVKESPLPAPKCALASANKLNPPPTALERPTSTWESLYRFPPQGCQKYQLQVGRWNIDSDSDKRRVKSLRIRMTPPNCALQFATAFICKVVQLPERNHFLLLPVPILLSFYTDDFAWWLRLITCSMPTGWRAVAVLSGLLYELRCGWCQHEFKKPISTR